MHEGNEYNSLHSIIHKAINSLPLINTFCCKQNKKYDTKEDRGESMIMMCVSALYIMQMHT